MVAVGELARRDPAQLPLRELRDGTVIVSRRLELHFTHGVEHKRTKRRLTRRAETEQLYCTRPLLFTTNCTVTPMLSDFARVDSLSSVNERTPWGNDERSRARCET